MVKRYISHAERVANRMIERARKETETAEIPAIKHTIRGIDLENQMDREGRKAFNDNERFWGAGDVFSQSDLDSARLIRKKPSAFSRFIFRRGNGNDELRSLRKRVRTIKKIKKEKRKISR